jgi:hypothetical protein
MHTPSLIRSHLKMFKKIMPGCSGWQPEALRLGFDHHSGSSLAGRCRHLSAAVTGCLPAQPERTPLLILVFP